MFVFKSVNETTSMRAFGEERVRGFVDKHVSESERMENK